jgi:hypothetical protein
MTDKTTRLKHRYAPMTKAQLKSVIADYAARFPDWELVHDGMAFVRGSGPVQQMIWFQKMSSAAYRPTHSIRALALPDAHIRMLPQIMDVKHREVEYRLHEQKFANTLAAMEQQFQPDIRKPLDIAEVLALCEARAGEMPDSTNNMAMLAILSAWLDRKAEALDYCERMQHCPLPTLAPMLEWENSMSTFGRALAKAVEAGTAREFLESAAEETKAR